MCKKLIGLLMAASFVLPFAAGCSEENSNEPSGEVTVYEDALQAPAYEEISDTQKYTSYYFDSENGDDKNDGLSETAPKRTVSAANALIKGVEEEKPVQMLFKAGTEYGEELRIVSFRAAEETPLLIGAYGQSEENEYAKFTAEPYCVEISGSNVRVEGLETQSRTARRGIYVYTSEAGATKNIVLRNNYIHDVNFL